MKRSIALILLAVICYSCKDSKSTGFDLSEVTLNQKIDSVVVKAGLKMDAGESKESTVDGYKIFESSDPGFMKFKGVSLAGKTGDSINKVLIHYALADKIVKLVEIKVFSDPEVKALRDILDQKLGKALFPAYAYNTVLGPDARYYERAWITPETNTGYFFTDALNEKDKEEAALAIVDYSDKKMSTLIREKAYVSDVDMNVEALKELMAAQQKK